MAIRIVKNVPEAEVAAVEGMLLASGATSVSHMSEGDGEFTITALFPDVEKHGSLMGRLG